MARVPLQSVAGDGVAHRQREKGEPEGQHDDVHHLHAPSGEQNRAWSSRRARDAAILICMARRLLQPARSGVSCHWMDIFSRWKRLRLYRNLIKTRWWKVIRGRANAAGKGLKYCMYSAIGTARRRNRGADIPCDRMSVPAVPGREFIDGEGHSQASTPLLEIEPIHEHERHRRLRSSTQCGINVSAPIGKRDELRGAEIKKS